VHTLRKQPRKECATAHQRRRITVTSSSNEKSTDQQENWVVVREEGFTPQSNYICRMQINVWRLPKYQNIDPPSIHIKD
jgi:hypothetical protein